MAFVDNAVGGRVVLFAAPAADIVLTDTCSPGDLIGLSGTTWVRADSANNIPPVWVAVGACSTSGNTIKASRFALIDFGSGSTAAVGNQLYAAGAASTTGRYTATAPGVQYRVGRMINATQALVDLDAVGSAVDYKTVTGAANASTLAADSFTITTEALTTAAGATYIHTMTNANVVATDRVLWSVDKGASTGTPAPTTAVVTAGSIVFTVQNIHASVALNTAVKINGLVVH